MVDARRTPTQTQGLIRSEPSPRDRRRPTEGVPALVIYNRAGGRAGRFSIHLPTSHDIYITRRGRRSTWPLGGKMRSMDASGPTVQVQRRWMITFVSWGHQLRACMLACLLACIARCPSIRRTAMLSPLPIATEARSGHGNYWT